MHIYNLSLDNNFVMDKQVVACIGYFDGLHLGHQILIKETIKQAKTQNVESCLISFTPDPWTVINHLDKVKHINTFQQRLEIMEALGIDNVIFVKFTLKVAHLAPEKFVSDILFRCNLKTLVCGFDFHYGYRGKGDFETLKNDSKDLFNIIEIDKVVYLKEKVSSTRIIKEINNGNVELVNILLNYDYFIESTVIKGRQKGRTIGFPTCNLEENDEIVVMKNGIYIGYVNYQGKNYKAMINIGHNPTFNYIENNSIEVHILDFSKDIYGEKIKLIFKKYICDEKKYNNIEDLKIALNHYSKLASEQEDL